MLLVIEVAESSLDLDRGEKLEIYAEAGIADYWIVNLVDFTIEVYRRPSGSGYLSTQKLAAGDFISPLAFPTAQLAVDYIFPK